MNSNEQVVLVNEFDEKMGLMGKMEAHKKALLHRAFSVFIFNKNGELLLQQRAMSKYHSGGLWTNTCCSHPRPDEEPKAGALRRLNEEMGFETPLEKIFDFIYKASFENGLTEYEFDHVYIGYYDGPINPNPAEVNDYKYCSMESILNSLQSKEGLFTAWLEIIFPKMMQWWTENWRNSKKNS
ncbi:MAG: isopentenyl-diphosphate Delta-isomerase [Chitinophagaceae bacterium]|nr:isopentenyl-diphosphate Delta-isomerase [Chitinophagaceae bacterium]